MSFSPLTLLLVAACADDAATDVFTLDECPAGTECQEIADGASRFTVQACIADSVESPWRSGESGAPDLTLAMSVAGGTFPDGTTTYTGMLDAQQRCLPLSLVAGTGGDAVVTATYLDVVQMLQIPLAPADVELVNLSSSVPYFDPTDFAQITITADVVGRDGASVSDGTRISFTAAPDPATVGYTLTPTTAYVQSGQATADVVVFPGATQVMITATATPPTWGEQTGAPATSSPFVVYAHGAP
jgi:hypothetical protein